MRESAHVIQQIGGAWPSFSRSNMVGSFALIEAAQSLHAIGCAQTSMSKQRHCTPLVRSARAQLARLRQTQ